MDRIEMLMQLHLDSLSIRTRIARQRLEANEIHHGQLPILVQIAEKGFCTQAELAKALQISAASAAVSIKRMERCGLVRRMHASNDQRVKLVELTDKGTDAAQICRAHATEMVDRMTQGFTDEELEQYVCFCRRMNDNLIRWIDVKSQKEEST